MIYKNIKLPNRPIDDCGFGEVEWMMCMSWSSDDDRRLMSFIDILWGFEVTGGLDQFEPLVVTNVQRSGLARRGGIRVNDIITKINDTPANVLTLRDAQLLIRESGKFVRIYVKGDDDIETDDELTVDFWFTPPKKQKSWTEHVQNSQFNGVFPWNDRSKKIYRESNCFMVPSKAEEHIKHLPDQTLPVEEDPDNVTAEDPENKAANDAKASAEKKEGEVASSEITPAAEITSIIDSSDPKSR